MSIKGDEEMYIIKSVMCSSKAENAKKSIFGRFSKFPRSYFLT